MPTSESFAVAPPLERSTFFDFKSPALHDNLCYDAIEHIQLSITSPGEQLLLGEEQSSAMWDGLGRGAPTVDDAVLVQVGQAPHDVHGQLLAMGIPLIPVLVRA